MTPENKPQADLPQEQATAPEVKADAAPAEKVAEKAEDPNWRAFREARKKDRQDLEEAQRKAAEKEAEAAALKAAMEAAFARESKSDQRRAERDTASTDYPEEESEDERIEKKVQAALAAREQILERNRAEREQREYPQRLQQTYQDFSEVVNAENLDYLEYHYPEVSSPLKRLPEGYDKWSDIYKAVKKFVPNSVSAKKDAVRASSNMAKPKSISSPQLTQTGEAANSMRLSEEKKAENWARMQKTLRGLSS